MPISFTIFLISLGGLLLLFGVRFFEYIKGEIGLLLKLRKHGDKLLIKFFHRSKQKFREFARLVKKRVPELISDVYWRIRRSRLRIVVKKALVHTSRSINSVLVVLLRFFGRARKRLDEVHQKHKE